MANEVLGRIRGAVLLACWLLCSGWAFSQSASPTVCPSDLAQSGSLLDAGMHLTQLRMQDVRTTSFPELSKTDLRLRTFKSRSDYFRTRFSFSRFFLPVKMRYFVEVNPAMFALSPPGDGVCAILAHELSHVVAMSRGNRIRDFALVRLLSKSFTAKFERRTDLEAIHRGYGDGLESYRRWVYAHIPPDALEAKKRNYFSPEEIEAIEGRLMGEPGLYLYWKQHVPLSLGQVSGTGR